jgi:hypothetical protein
MHASGGERALMYAPGREMTYNRVYISVSLCIHIYANIKRFATTFRLDQYFRLITLGFYFEN